MFTVVGPAYQWGRVIPARSAVLSFVLFPNYKGSLVSISYLFEQLGQVAYQRLAIFFNVEATDQNYL